MRFVSIASGSSGNCIYVGSERSHILVDVGISNKMMEQGLNEIGLKGSEIQGIVMTHEHSDHTRGLGVMARKYGVPVYGTRETLDEIQGTPALGKFPEGLFQEVQPDVPFQVGDLEIEPFSIDHDAANPVAYRISNDKKCVAVATDMGNFNQYVIDHLRGLDALLLEANHDVNMLETGPYPYYLKRRILGDHGHLSNENAGRLLNYILHDNIRHILLGHLSKENNYEELARETVKLEIDQGDTFYKASDFPIEVARRDALSQIINL